MTEKETLESVLKDFKIRLEILEKRKQTLITSGRINEIQMCISYLYDKILSLI